mgnify:FL=1
MSELKEVTLPPEMHVACPLRKFHLVPAVHCDRPEARCAHFHGLEQVLANPGLPFEATYRIRCGHPIGRQMHFVEHDA